MNNFGIRILFLLSLLTLAACGGGDGSEHAEIADLEGTWTGRLELVLDQCFLAVNFLQETHQIDLDGHEVTLISTDGRILEGEVLSADSFAAEISSQQPFPSIDRVTYESISSGTAEVTISHIWSRPGGCVTTWKGTMTLSRGV